MFTTGRRILIVGESEEEYRARNPEISEELSEAIAALEPASQIAARLLWRDVTAFARENARRLDEATATIHRMLLILSVALVLLVGTMVATGVASVTLGGRIATNQQSDTKALCSLRDDVQRRVDSGNAFLVTHPNGVFGLSAATIRAGIVNEQRTLTALSPLICPKPGPHPRAHRSHRHTGPSHH